MFVFLLTGIWHGANPTFVFWGIYHGILNVIEDTILPIKRCKIKWIGNLYTWLLVIIGFVFFRSESLSYAFAMIRTMFTGFYLPVGEARILAAAVTPYICVLVFIAIVFSYPVAKKIREAAGKIFKGKGGISDGVMYAGVLLLFLLCVCSLACDGYNPFIYFRF